MPRRGVIASFVNGGFEDGNFTGWTKATDLNYYGLAVVPPQNSTSDLNLSPGGYDYTYIRTGATESQIPAGLSSSATLRYPRYGTATAVVNERGDYYNVNRLSQAMVTTAADVDASDGKIHIRFALAPVLENPNHSAASQPYFYVELRNKTKSSVLFHTFNFANQPGVPWKTYGSVQYTDWQSFDVAPGPAGIAIGDEVEIEIIAAGCAAGGHWGEVYLDAFGAFIPGLAVAASAPQSANAGSDITYTFVTKNGGTTTADNVIVTETLPTGVTFKSLSAPGADCTQPSVGGTGNVVCNVGSLNPSATYTFTVTVTINSGATGKISNGNYNVRGDGISPLIGPLVETTITSGVSYANLGVTLSNGVAALARGEAADYTIVVSNAGPSAVTGATVVNTIPAELTSVSWTCTYSDTTSCGTGTSNINTALTLAVGATATFAVGATVDASTVSTRLTNTATVSVPTGVTDNDTNDNTAVDIDDIGSLYTVTVSKGTSYGTGRVVSSPAAIDCSSGCTSANARFLSGSSVSFTATADTGSTFSGWSGACTGTNSICTFTVSEDTTLTAAFTTPGLPITSSVTGGNGTIACDSPVVPGESTTCTMTPDTGYVLDTLTDNAADVFADTSNCDPTNPPVTDASPAGCTYTISAVSAAHTVVATFKKGLATTCGAATECHSGFCADGVCCTAACTGQCQACDATGSVGTCVPVTGAPHGTRTACATDGSVCAGACDGEGVSACAYPGTSTSCRSASCTAGVGTLAAGCNAAGSCPATQTVTCSPYICGSTACLTECAQQSDCVETHFCERTSCVPKKSNGSSCAKSYECTTGLCVDGVCCDAACGGQCQACDVAGSVGTCTPVKGSPHGGRASCVGDGSACSGACDGSRADGCAYPGASQQCRAPSCVGGVVTLAAACLGTGLCPTASTRTCSPLSCSGDQCASGCQSDAECGSGRRCAAGQCVARLTPGASCTDGKSCSSGFCVDGVCCNSECTGQCEACNATDHVGTCTPVSGKPRGARNACAGDGTACGGTCDGSQGSTCSYPGGSVTCRAASCTGGVASLRATCDGNGGCSNPGTQSCGTAGCSGDICAGGCTDSATCGAGLYCSAGVCVQRKPIGGTCLGAEECANGLCVDGVCCDRACQGQCEACNLPGRMGTCAAVVGSPRGGRPLCAGTAPCQGSCDGATTLACTFPGATSTCGSAMCIDNVARAAATCDGLGSCQPGAVSDCGAAGCDGTVCAGEQTGNPPPTETTCSSHAECAGGACVNGVCKSSTQLKASGGCNVSGGGSGQAGMIVGLVLAMVLGGSRRRRRSVRRQTNQD